MGNIATNKIRIYTTDGIIWNENQAIIDLVYSMSISEEITIDLNAEGVCCDSVGIYNLLEQCSNKFDYDLSRISIHTSNQLERHDEANIIYQFPIHLVKNVVDEYHNIAIKKNLNKHFGVFVGRGNPLRLYLNTILNLDHRDITIQSYRFNINDDYYRNNIGLELLMTCYNISDISQESLFLSKCPMLLNGATEVKYRMDSDLNLSQQLDNTNKIHQYYNNFFVEIVHESFYTGNTFFPTEKIWRPMILKTPFIVQGPQWYLKHLKEMGFKTFDRWWDEGYSEDPPTHAISEIKKVIDFLSKKSITELTHMYFEMTDILEHNYDTLIELTKNGKYE